MNGQIWVGKSSQQAGRSGEAASHGLIELLDDLGFESGRLKTGTPARVDRRTIDFSVLEPQPGDAEAGWFSFDKSVHVPREQMPCYLTHTNHKTHNMIRVWSLRFGVAWFCWFLKIEGVSDLRTGKSTRNAYIWRLGRCERSQILPID